MTYPLDLMRARMATDSHINPKYAQGYTRAFREVIKNEGFTALYRGLRVTLLGIMPYAGLSFTTYHTLKAQAVSRWKLNSERDIPRGYSVAFGGIAGLVGQSVTYPLDIVRRRMQVSSGDQYRTIWGSLVQIVKNEGLRGGLYKGLSMNWIKGPIAVTISFNVNDFVKQLLRRVNDDTQLDIRSERLGEIESTTSVEALASGGLAGAISKTILAPLDMVKILYQVRPKWHFSVGQASRTAARVAEKGGLDALWAGNVAAVMRVMPFSAITFLTFDRFELACMRTLQRDTDPLCRFLAGSAAGATATILTYPFDLLRTRQANSWNCYSGYISACEEMIRQEGVGTLYNGLKPTLVGILPYAGISFATFHTLKAQIKDRGEDGAVPILSSMACGMVAGFFSQTVTYPFHIVRRRAQLLGGDVYRTQSVWQSLKSIYETEGLRQGLFKGMLVTWAKGPITVAMTFTLNDYLKARFSADRLRHHQQDLQHLPL
jgi:solute carrier family 25 protein 42